MSCLDQQRTFTRAAALRSFNEWRCRGRRRGRLERRTRIRTRRPAAAASTRSRSAPIGGCWPPAALTPPIARSWPSGMTPAAQPRPTPRYWNLCRPLWCALLTSLFIPCDCQPPSAHLTGGRLTADLRVQALQMPSGGLPRDFRGFTACNWELIRSQQIQEASAIPPLLS